MSTPTKLKDLTTLKVGGEVGRTYVCGDVITLQEAIGDSRAQGLPWYPLGGGSNVLAPDEGFPGSLLLMRMPGVRFEEQHDGSVLCVAGAGVDWNELVDATLARGLWGLENLAGIPGNAGAAPIQNIGAYGVELSDVLSFVEVYDTDAAATRKVPASVCDLAYRDSRFKREPHLLITSIGLRLRTEATPKTAYKDIAQKVEEGRDVSTPAAVAALVREIRSGKFPSLAEYGTAGSFFKNPLIAANAYEALKERYPNLPGYPAGAAVKVSLAWILDNVLALRGLTMSAVSLYEKQPLVLVTRDGATAHEVNALAEEVARRVFAATGITIEREVRAIEPRA